MQAEKGPFILRFKKPIALKASLDPLSENGVKFDKDRLIWVDEQGYPIYAAASKPYTQVYTAAHTIKGGYTPSGKVKPTRVVPGKMDKRSGK